MSGKITLDFPCYFVPFGAVNGFFFNSAIGTLFLPLTLLSYVTITFTGLCKRAKTFFRVTVLPSKELFIMYFELSELTYCGLLDTY